MPLYPNAVAPASPKPVRVEYLKSTIQANSRRPAGSSGSLLLSARSRTDDDFVHVHVRGLFDGISHGTSDGIGFEGDLAELFHRSPSAGVGDSIRQFRFHRSESQGGSLHCLTVLDNRVSFEKL